MEGLKSQMPVQNPLQGIKQAVGSALAGDTRLSHMQSMNEGPVSNCS